MYDNTGPGLSTGSPAQVAEPVRNDELNKQAEVPTAEPTKGVVVATYAPSQSLVSNSKGIVVRQTTQWPEIVIQTCLGCPIEEANQYAVSPLPEGKQALRSQSGSTGWRPVFREYTSLPAGLTGIEDSDCCCRFLMGCVGCMNLRPLTIPFSRSGTFASEFTVQRACNLGGWICCPHTSYLQGVNEQGQLQMQGTVVEDWKCCDNYIKRCLQAVFCCTLFFDMFELSPAGPIKKYHMKANWCCCGPHNNFCGATCCYNDMLFNVYKFENNALNMQPVGYMQKTYLPGDQDSALLRCCCKFSNWIVEFPDGATDVEKKLFVTGMINTEYVLFERRGVEWYQGLGVNLLSNCINGC